MPFLPPLKIALPGADFSRHRLENPIVMENFGFPKPLLKDVKRSIERRLLV